MFTTRVHTLHYVPLWPYCLPLLLCRLNSVHQKEVEQLQHKLKAELQAMEEELVRERNAALAETRHKLAAEQIKEERHLKAEMEKALEETRKKLQDEEDNEEAELHESKTNRVIKIKQQVCQMCCMCCGPRVVASSIVAVGGCYCIYTYV